ncbi:MAG TPA: serine hydrolase, partial [Mycobacterium sp.]|nr:serine hydrolase [Mycobacterium sp.]
MSACGGGHDAAPTTTSSAASSATSDHAEAKARSENVLDRAIEAGSPGCSAAVGVKGNAVWTGVRGVADMSSGTAITTQAVFDIASVSKQFTARQPGAVAAYESEHKSERPKSARVQQAKQGKYHGGMRCYGYEKDGITIRANEAAEIASACTAIAGGASLRSIVRDMNARKVPTTRGKVGGWTSRQLRLMLMSPRIAGICICGESALRSSSNGGS